ncbi:MAG: transposase [Elusimicrobiota bacterium]|nr:transposase [Elusimicrobiota bacterium]
MPRRKRFTVDNGVYHILSRGNNRQQVFKKDEDFKQFINIVKHYKTKFNLKIYHYQIMSNHFHFIIEAKEGRKLSEAFRGIKLLYTQYYREKYGGSGHLWEDRFKSFIIEKGRYLSECGRYIELNAVRAGIVNQPEDYKWSSYRAYSFGEKNELVDLSPEYLGLGETAEIRQRLYKEFIADGHKEKRKSNRFFKSGVYGSKEFIDGLKKEGLKPLWSHKGRPKK